MVWHFDFFFFLIKLPEINFSFWLHQWWFQNCRRRARQLGSSRVSTSTRETNRQHRRSTPCVSRQSRQG
jgi:hypothetical protein